MFVECLLAAAGTMKPNSCVLDIGANCGYFSLLACSYGRTVYSFEPLQSNIRLLAASRISNHYTGRLEIIPAAASDTAGLLMIGSPYSNGIVAPVPQTPASALDAD